MSIVSFYNVELRRLLKSKTTWLIALLSILAATAPLLLGVAYDGGTRFMNFIGVCNQWGSLGGGILFAMLSLYELSKMYRSHADSVIETIASPQKLYLARTLALLTAGFAAGILIMLLLLPYGLLSMSDIFETVFYMQSFLLLTTCSILLSILFAAALHAITRRVSVSMIIFLAVGYVCTLSMQFYIDPLLKWLMPTLYALSDDFGNDIIIKLYSYNRLIWFLLFGGLFFFSVLCMRKYGRGLLGSLRANIKGKQVVSLLLVAVLSVSGVVAYAKQPFYDNSPPLDFDISYGDEDDGDDGENAVVGGDGFVVSFDEAEQDSALRLQHSEFDVDIDADHGSLSGTVTHTVVNNSGAEMGVSLYINPGYTVESIHIDSAVIAFEDLQNDTDGTKEITFSVPASKSEQTIEVKYGGKYIMWNLNKGIGEGSEGIYERYISLGSRGLFPHLDDSNGTDVHTTGTITMPERFVLASSGASNCVISEGDGRRTWSVDVQSNTVTIEAGEYVRKEIHAGGLTIEFFYGKKHEAVMEEMGVVELMEHVVNYFTDLLGPLPYDRDIPFKIIQGTAFLSGGYARDNISVMGEMYFSNTNFADLDKGASSQEVLVHEIIHQWWGTTMMCYDMEETWWTNEGITVYCTYLYVRDRYGDEYANTHYLEHWKSDVADMLDNFYFRHPSYQEVLSEQYLYELEASYSSTQMYSMTALMIYNAEQLVGNDKIQEAMVSLYENGGMYLQPYITFQDFLDATGLKKEDISIV